ncbi:MAG TPA: hypothetical protein VE998_09635 [Terriglobales bacterium]|nr:hypothetical protein [Terriglobales bacterium]
MTRTPDFPDFDTYPAASALPGRALPPADASNEAMNNAAERVGNAVGSAVAVARRLPQQLNSTLSSVKDRLVLVKGRGVREVNARAAGLKEAAGNTARDAQQRARYYANEYPLHVLGVVAGLAFLAGFGLRIWRGSRG